MGYPALKNKPIPITELKDGDLWAAKGWVLFTVRIPYAVIVYYVDMQSWCATVTILKDTAHVLIKTF